MIRLLCWLGLHQRVWDLDPQGDIRLFGRLYIDTCRHCGVTWTSVDPGDY